ncbi:hypothetical protein HID58_010883 [Brassica napus]|uniref:Hexosyltransferase n=1 Tax=Brassica napus TaxID=3708 RepID=A0ABQ8DWK9_BRANA|nr:hypothetical protein HID58_010883 [Brassica napus]
MLIFFSYRIFISALFSFLFLATFSVVLNSSRHQPHLDHTLPRTFQSDPLKTRLDLIHKQATDHLTLVNAYAAYARKLKLDASKQLKLFEDLAVNFSDLQAKPGLKLENGNAIEEDAFRQIEKEVKDKVKTARMMIVESKESYDTQLKIQKLKDTIFAVQEQLTKAKKNGAVASLISAKSVPKSLNCLAMRLVGERISNPEKYKDAPFDSAVEDPSLYHYAVFSDNVIAVSVVVRSVVVNAEEPWKHVFHVVTDRMNLAAMKVWFKMRPLDRGARVEIKSVEEFKFLNSSYAPVLRQLESAKLQKFYFENQAENATNIKFKNPKYLSVLNHLRFYLPEMYPKLNKILFLDDDVVVQKDVTGLWKINLDGKVNGAVETCFGSFHRYGQYLNFTHPLIKESFNPNACAWAFGMNIFDLNAWRREKCTDQYHYWQNLTLPRTFQSDPLKTRLDLIHKQATDHLTLVNAYAAYARKLKLDASKQLKLFEDLAVNFSDLQAKPGLKLENGNAIEEDAFRQIEKEVKDKVKTARMMIVESKESYDTQLKIQKLKDTIFAVQEQLTKAKKNGAVASLISAKSVPKSLNCLAMRLVGERISNPEKYKDAPFDSAVEDPSLYHYAVFSDNVIAVSVVVRSVVVNAEEPWKHVFHVVTDRMNLAAMKVWFKMRPLDRGARVEIKSVEEFKFLNSSYAPVLRQLESAKLQKFYFENQAENATRDEHNIKFKNPKYLSVLNHLRFYLPEMYPKLNKILFLDDDVVVQKDVTGLWKINLDGKVNGAVETCFGSFHRYGQYLNFTHPLIKESFNPNACAWAFGMNIFDLNAWRREKCTDQYHYWQNLNEDRSLWKLGTLPPGLMTFYSKTKSLDKSWHVLGLGYNPGVSMDEIKKAAVIHYNGNMKPWLDIAMNQYKSLWTKYVDNEMEFVQMCNFGL